MVRALIVMIAKLALLLVIAPIVRLQAQNDSGASVPAHSTVAPAKGRWNDLLAKWRQNKPKLKACRAEARKKGLAGDDRWSRIVWADRKSLSPEGRVLRWRWSTYIDARHPK